MKPSPIGRGERKVNCPLLAKSHDLESRDELPWEDPPIYGKARHLAAHAFHKHKSRATAFAHRENPCAAAWTAIIRGKGVLVSKPHVSLDSTTYTCRPRTTSSENRKRA